MGMALARRYWGGKPPLLRAAIERGSDGVIEIK